MTPSCDTCAHRLCSVHKNPCKHCFNARGQITYSEWEPQRFPSPFSPEDLTAYTNALSDALCWLEGFISAGGTYSPGTINELRSLNTKLKGMLK